MDRIRAGPVAETMRYALMPMVTIRGEEVDFRPLTPQQAALLQQVCTALGLHDYCPFHACRRAHRCATRQVLCDQFMRQEINAIVTPIFRERLAKTAAAAGGNPRRRP
jgi:hypothetical protein